MRADGLRARGRIPVPWEINIGELVLYDYALRGWVSQSEWDAPAAAADDRRTRWNQLERENLDLKRANEILREAEASAFVAEPELDSRAK